MALSMEQVAARVKSLRYRHAERDARNAVNLDEAFASQWSKQYG